MVKIILIVIVVLIVALLAYAATRPNSFRIQRTKIVKASPEKIVPLIADFHSWGSWSPWEKVDPSMKRTFSGAASGKGAVYAWEGNGKAGSGRMEIKESSPSKVTIQLDFIKPFEAHNTAEFTLEPVGDGTNVTWAMYGPSPFIAKVMGIFFNMDRVVGKDFETGLENLKAVAEG
ncbi:MAG TPA: SRPBCC family protein [Thermoanaerobaculia bacterium]|nr:SRPBCC family protein [Thermoanaerobaculia bacterium]